MSGERYVCIHGHFYQPPRENPWLEAVEVQDSAHPFHDWNERVAAECYAPNATSRILDGDGAIIDLSNNYAKISSDFGPTLLTWLERHDPRTYQAVLEADRLGRERFAGHGPAMAQAYNHIILPLAESRDKRSQILWGLRDFAHRFGRQAEGMWLAEAAVDLESLEIMAELGVRFTVLAPRQAQRVRRLGEEQWHDVSGARIDPRRAYQCVLPSGRSLALFFYDGPIAQDLAFAGLLDSGERLAARLLGAFSPGDEAQLAHVATDGESYGHHHARGDMALAYGLYHLERSPTARLTVYGEFLALHPPTYQVEIFPNSSWSCVHGVERWRADCGCNTGGHPGWNQQWRAPLRGALDWLRDNLATAYVREMSRLCADPWAARDDFIAVILDRSPEARAAFLSRHAIRRLTPAEEVTFFELLELQRHALLMYTSCGWFFDEVSGLETQQVLGYAARAMQLASSACHLQLTETFAALLERAPSNIPEFGTARGVFAQLIEPAILDLTRVGAHYAVYSLFADYREREQVYCFDARQLSLLREDLGRLRLRVGRVALRSQVTGEEQTLSFAVIYFGDHNLSGGVRPFIDEQRFAEMRGEIRDCFTRGDAAGTVRLIEKHFESGAYSLWHLFRDQQRQIVGQILDAALDDVERTLRRLKEQHYATLEVTRRMGMPLPRILSRIAELIHSADFLDLMAGEAVDVELLRRANEEARRWGVEPDRVTAAFTVSRRVNRAMLELEADPERLELLRRVEGLLVAVEPLQLELDLWMAQNVHFTLDRRHRPALEARAAEGDVQAQAWLAAFAALAPRLGVKVR